MIGFLSHALDPVYMKSYVYTLDHTSLIHDIWEEIILWRFLNN